MSATGRGAERRADDFYETPGWCTRAILPHLIPNLPERHIVLEPGSGSGSIARELLAAGVTRERLMLIELDADRATQCCEDLRCVVNNWDFVTWAKHNEGLPDFKRSDNPLFAHNGAEPVRDRFDLIIANPPYSIALEFIEAALSMRKSQGVVAFLLRINFLGSQERADWHRAHPCKLYVLPRRPSFTGGGTDATEYAWFVWGEGHEAGTWEILDVEPTERKAGVSHPAKLPVERFERLELL